MKKISIVAISAILCAASQVQGLSFDWTATGLNFGGASLNNAPLTFELVYLGTAGTLAGSYGLDGFDASSVGTVANTVNVTYLNKGGAGDNKFDFTSNYAVGDVFAMLVSYEYDGKTWYNLSTVVFSAPASAWESPPPTLSPVTFASGMNNKVNDSLTSTALVAGGGWYAVPEPATAALALAGLALLIRRRK